MSGLLLSPGAARADSDDIKHLEDEAVRAINESRLADAFEKLKTLYAATGLFWDACNAGRTAFLLGRMVEAHDYTVDLRCRGLEHPQEQAEPARETGA